MRRTLLLLLTLTLATPVLGQYLLAIPSLDPPTFTSPDTDPAGFNVAENTTAITTVVATGDGTITYSVSGTDSALVTIGESSGVLAFIDPPNYEGPLDVGGDNVYTFNVVASNGTPASFGCNVTVTDEEEGSPEPPTITNADPLNVSMGENSTAVADIDATGDAPITFSKSGTDASLFTINSSTGVLSFTDAPDYETPGDVGGDNVYNLTVTAANGVSPDDSIDVVVTVTDVDESEYAYYNSLVASGDHLISMSMRSQSEIDANSFGSLNAVWPAYVAGTNTQFVYDGTMDAGHCICGSYSIINQVGKNFSKKTTGHLVAIRDLYFDPNYFDHAQYLGNQKFSMLGHEGSTPFSGNDRRRLEWRAWYNGGQAPPPLSSSRYSMDLRGYYISSTYSNTIPLTNPNAYMPTGEWIRIVESVDMTLDPAEYSCYIVESDGSYYAAYDGFVVDTLVEADGLNRWTPIWFNTSQSEAEIESMTADGTTVTVNTPVPHDLEVGDDIRIGGNRPPVETGYAGLWVVASVVDEDTFTYEASSTPSGSPATAGSSGEITYGHGVMSAFWTRNNVLLWNASQINLTPILVGDDL